MSKVLIINPFYLPGYKSGGPQRTVENIAEIFGATNDIYILTQDHDMGSDEHYSGIDNNKWIKMGNAEVMYVSSKEFKWSAIKKAYFHFDLIYSCGMFEKNTIALLLLHRFFRKKYGKNKKIYVAPMGVFSPAAFNNASYKKKVIFVDTYKKIKAFKTIIWSFTTESEVKQAENILGYRFNKDEYIIAEDIPRLVDFEYYNGKIKNYNKIKNKLNLVYISRISPQKNLIYALQILNNRYQGEINFDIYGPLEDISYWEKSETLMKKLPLNIHTRYCGELIPDDVVDVLSKYDAFLLPTKGENFGHIIYESMAVGCIPIISNRTPWKENGIISHDLDDISKFVDDINKLLKMETEEIQKRKYLVQEYAKEKYIYSVENSGYKQIFV